MTSMPFVLKLRRNLRQRVSNSSPAVPVPVKPVGSRCLEFSFPPAGERFLIPRTFTAISRAVSSDEDPIIELLSGATFQQTRTAERSLHVAKIPKTDCKHLEECPLPAVPTHTSICHTLVRARTSPSRHESGTSSIRSFRSID